MKLSEIVESALQTLDGGSVILRAGHSQNLRWANSALTTNGDSFTSTMTVIAIDSAHPDRVGIAAGQVFGPEAARDLVGEAKLAAHGAQPTDAVPLWIGQADPEFEQEPAEVDPAQTATMMDTVGTFLDQPQGQFGYAELETTTTYLGTTSGTRSRHVQDSVRLEASARTDAASTWWGSNTLAVDLAAVTRQQTQQLDLQGERAELAPGRHPVILTPAAVADLLIYLTWSAGARDAMEGHSVFAKPGGGTRLGERLTDRSLRLFADPRYEGLATSPHVCTEVNSSLVSVFDNGMPLTQCDLIDDGRLVNLRASRATSERFGLPTAYLADNLILDDAHGHGSLDDLIARTDDAVLITCLWYIREVDPQNLLLTGLTRDGVYRVQGGQIVAGLPNFRFNVSVTDLLARIRDASLSSTCLPREWADWFTRTSMPALLVDDFNLSSSSDAR